MRIIEVTTAGAAAPRRVFSEEDKARIVTEAMAPGSSVRRVARLHALQPSLIYRWRRRLLREQLAPAAALPPAFVPVEVAPGAARPASPAPSLPPGAVEIATAGGSVVRLAPPVDARVLRLLLDTLR